MTFGALSLLPPLLAIGLAIWTRQVYVSLAAGIWLGWTIDAGWNPLAGFAGTVDGTIDVMTDPGTASVLLFTFIIGALIALVPSVIFFTAAQKAFREGIVMTGIKG